MAQLHISCVALMSSMLVRSTPISWPIQSHEHASVTKHLVPTTECCVCAGANLTAGLVCHPQHRISSQPVACMSQHRWPSSL